MSEELPSPDTLWWHWLGLGLLLVLSALASMSETVMMAANRYRLRALAEQGHRGARLAVALIEDTARLLGVILLLNNVINVGAATLASVITLALFGSHESALLVGSLTLTFLIVVFSELTPKVIGAHHADALAPWFAYPLTLLLRLLRPVVDAVNVLVRALLHLMRLHERANGQSGLAAAEEVRAVVQQHAAWRSPQHRALVLNLLDLERLTVADVMTPRRHIECLDICSPISTLREQIATAFHTRLPLLDGKSEEVIGIVHARHLLAQLLAGETLTHELLRQVADSAYFIPEETPVLTQLQAFQEQEEKLALVIDEYGELRGLVSVEDIAEEIVGNFTRKRPHEQEHWQWDKDGTVTVEGNAPLRALNRALGIDLPLEHGNTLNGLLLAQLQTMPEGEVALRFGDVVIDVLQRDERKIRVARLIRLGVDRRESTERGTRE